MNEPEPRRRDLGYVPLAIVAIGWLTFCIGIGVALIYGGSLMALVIVLADAQAGRRLSRPALVALGGSVVILVAMKLAGLV